MPNNTTSTARPRPLGELALDLFTGKKKFTDLHIESGKPAMLRLSAGQWIEALDEEDRPMVIEHDAITEFLNGVFSDEHPSGGAAGGVKRWKHNLHENGALHPAVNLSRATSAGEFVTCRVRCTVQKQMMGESIGLVLRPLRDIPTSIESLGLPIQVSAMLRSADRGLIVVTGPTGSGKSTTLAAIVNDVNKSKRANILTIEDPVEFVHERDKSIINQRELGIDVSSYEEGVRDALRFVPDVILIGEIRDAPTMRAALRAAESGHLVLTTTHASTTVAAIRKMIAYLDNSQSDVQALASCLVGVIAQALVRDTGSTGSNFLAYEVLNCRDSQVADVVGASASDITGQKMTMLEDKVRTGELQAVALPMIDSLRKLVQAGSVDAASAASVAVHADDKSELFKIAQARSKGGASWGRSTFNSRNSQ